MLSTLASLTFWQIRNRVRVRLARLKQPRYLLGSIAGIAYIGYFAILRNAGSMRGRGGAANFVRIAGPLELGVAVVLLWFAALVWLLPAAGSAVRFSPSEIQFLLPAPITRRQLLQYHLLRAQLGLLFGSVMATIFMRPTSFVNSWKFVTGLWLILMTCRVYFTGVSLYRQGLRQRGVGGIWKWAPAAIACAAAAFVAATIYGNWSELTTSDGPQSFFAGLDRIVSSGPVTWILVPFRSLTRLPLAVTTAAYLAALPGALMVLGINYLWVLRADTAFEESAALIAEKQSHGTPTRTRPRVRGTAATPFTLAPTGRLETAIVWKNLIMVGRYASLRTLLRLAPLVVAVGLIFSFAGGRREMAGFAAMLCLVMAANTVLAGPLMARNDLRRDLGNLAMLKGWPVSGATLLRGEILAPAVLLTAISGLFILGAGSLAGNLTVGALQPLVNDRLSYVTAALLLAPGLILVELTMLNGLAVLFPGWISTGATRSRGVDAIGQRLFTTAGVVLTLVIALLPALLVAGVVAAAIYYAIGVLVVVIPSAIIAGVLVVECFVVAEMLGRVLDRTDVLDVSPPE
ncbi:MAG: putative ABC exporter domain-containing protein [Vicinamibacterales bacterium]